MNINSLLSVTVTVWLAVSVVQILRGSPWDMTTQKIR